MCYVLATWNIPGVVVPVAVTSFLRLDLSSAVAKVRFFSLPRHVPHRPRRHFSRLITLNAKEKEE